MVQLPPTTDGFCCYERGPTRLNYDAQLVPENGRDELLNLPDIVRDLSGFQSRSNGRTTVWNWFPAWTDTPLFIREFVHGGLLRHAWGSLFLTDHTMRRELRINRYAWERDLPTCRPVALYVERCMGLVRRAFYVTRALPDAANLLTFCTQCANNLAPERRQNIEHDVAHVLATMHEYGIYHGDLNLKNLLILPEQHDNSVAVIDFKKAHTKNDIDIQQGVNNLIRLDRSILKWPASRDVISLNDRLRVFREYIKARCGPDTDWKTRLLQLRPHHWLHYLGRKT